MIFSMGATITTAVTFLCTATPGNEGPLVYQNPSWGIFIPAGIAFTLIALAIVGPRMKIPTKACWGLAFFGTIVGVIFLPMVHSERVVINETGIEQTGLILVSSRQGFTFEEIQEVFLKTDYIGRRQKPQTIWELSFKDGTTEDFNPADLWIRNIETILPALEKHGVKVTDLRNEKEFK
jgi:hypothetical protein